MRKLVVLAAAVFAVSAWFISHEAAAEGDALKAAGCTNCHDQDKKKVGPSLKDIAAKKPNVDDATAKIMSAKGHPKVKASEAEVKAAVQAAVATK